MTRPRGGVPAPARHRDPQAPSASTVRRGGRFGIVTGGALARGVLAASLGALVLTGCGETAQAGAAMQETDRSAKGMPVQLADTIPVGQRMLSVVGPYVPSATVRASGGVFSKYENDFLRYDEPQWSKCGPKWDCIDYYDRALIYYVWWQRTGISKYRDRATQIALDFRKRALEANHYGIVFHWAMMDGVALHYLVTGDTASLTAVGRVADGFAWQINGDPSGYIGDPRRMDDRIPAYAIKSLLLAYLLKAPSGGIKPLGVPGGNDWAAVLRTALTKILATRDPDGQWRAAKCGARGRATHPFTVGLLYDALARYYESFEHDERILPAIQQSANVLWSQNWIPASHAFQYVGIACPGEGGPTPAPDLNNLIVNGFAWVYHMTGEPSFRARADEIFAGSVTANSPSTGAKWFNQSYTSSFRYLVWRSGR
jgi:hypothetical protein